MPGLQGCRVLPDRSQPWQRCPEKAVPHLVLRGFVTDFWAAYNLVICFAKQKCLPHTLRNLSRTRHYHNPGEDWREFHRRLRRLIRDSMRLKKNKQGIALGVYERRKAKIRIRQTQATFMTILRTLKMRGHNSVQGLLEALKSYVRSRQLPPLPTKITAGG